MLIILAVDVTEFQNAEQKHREFSANVSHELETPLQGIIGSAELLEKSAEEKNASVCISGDGFAVQGVRRMLQEILYNLCDNAIKYNVPGGRVHIHIADGKLTVSDTSICIFAEHKDRIFERCYRVDKSHSKASGGTGLGLSLVKYAAA